MTNEERKVFYAAQEATQKANPTMNLDTVSPSDLRVIIRHTLIVSFETEKDMIAAKRFFDAVQV